MPGVRKLEAAVSEATGLPIGSVQNASRKLMDGGMLPKSVGRSVAQVEPAHLATLLVGLYAPGSVVMTARDTSSALMTVLNGWTRIEGASDEVNAGRDLLALDALRELIEPLWRSYISDDAPGSTLEFHAEIEVVQSWPEIVIRRPAGDAKVSTMRFVPPGKPADRWQSGKPRTATTIPGSVIATAVLHLRERV